jgi:hypothetical protein
VEIHFDGNLYGHRMTIFHGGIKAVFLGDFDGLFVQAHAQGAKNPYIPRDPIDANNHADKARALVLCLARFL